MTTHSSLSSIGKPFYRSLTTARLALIGLASFLVLSFMPPLYAHEFKIGDIQIKHPWSRAVPEGAKVAAGYFVVVNNGSTADKLLSVTADLAGMAELHEMSVDSAGVMTMRPLHGGLQIPAGGEIALKPGAMHIMFMDLKRLPKEGEKFAGTLTFEKAGTVKIDFAVDAIGGADHEDHIAN